MCNYKLSVQKLELEFTKRYLEKRVCTYLMVKKWQFDMKARCGFQVRSFNFSCHFLGDTLVKAMVNQGCIIMNPRRSPLTRRAVPGLAPLLHQGRSSRSQHLQGAQTAI